MNHYPIGTKIRIREIGGRVVSDGGASATVAAGPCILRDHFLFLLPDMGPAVPAELIQIHTDSIIERKTRG
jgi:hypothetical protein